MVLESCYDSHCNPAMNKMTSHFYANKGRHPQAEEQMKSVLPRGGCQEASYVKYNVQGMPAWV